MRLNICVVSAVILACVPLVHTASPDAVAADLSKWMKDTAVKSKKIVGLSGFIVAGTGTRTFATGDATLAKAYDKTSKKTVTSARKPVTVDTPFMLASVSKTITWTALSQLLDEKMFTLDAPIEDALGFRVRNPSFPAVKITYKHLYTHTSGLQDDYKGYLYDSKCPKSSPYPKSLTETMEPYVAKKANWGKKAPGSKYDYSNMGSTLAALLVEKISGQPFDTFTERHIFQRLGMASTSWARPTASADVYELRGTKYHTRSGGYCFPDWPSGQLHSSASDMAKFASSMLAGGRLWEGTGSTPKVGCLYSAATAVRAFKPQSPQTGDGDSALGWFVGKPYYPGGAGHDGSEFGVSSDLYIMTDSGVAIGWMANGALSDKEFETITAKFVSAAQAIGATKGLPPPAPGCVSKIMGEHPSLSTVAPTTSGPTTKKPAPCNDDPSWVRRRKHQTCVWIAKRASKRCRLKSKGKVTAKIGCPVTCGTC